MIGTFPWKLGAMLAVIVVWGTSGYATSAYAGEGMHAAQDIERICTYSEASTSTEGEGGPASGPKMYHRERRRLLQTTWELAVPSSELTVLGYDRVTGTLAMGGFKDLPLFEGAYHLRMREGCALHFELDEERAEDVVARTRLGTVSVRFGFHLDPHDDYERSICSSEPVEAGDDAGQALATRTLLNVDLLYAALVESDGTVLATFKTGRDHELHLRRVSQAIGAASAVRPRVEVTSVSRQSSEVSESLWESLEAAEQDWWTTTLESALFPCYIRGLRRNGRLQGAMVLRVPPGGAKVALLVDTLQVDELSQCILERVEEMRSLSPQAEEAVDIKATLLFRLD